MGARGHCRGNQQRPAAVTLGHAAATAAVAGASSPLAPGAMTESPPATSAAPPVDPLIVNPDQMNSIVRSHAAAVPDGDVSGADYTFAAQLRPAQRRRQMPGPPMNLFGPRNNSRMVFICPATYKTDGNGCGELGLHSWLHQRGQSRGRRCHHQRPRRTDIARVGIDPTGRPIHVRIARPETEQRDHSHAVGSPNFAWTQLLITWATVNRSLR